MKKKITQISIDNIMVNPENPRFEPVIAISEIFVMQQLLNSRKDAESMFKLICSIGNDGWFIQSILTVTYDKEKEKYIAWDGNRRLTALKILKNPSILKELEHFTHQQVQKILELSHNINDEDFFDISCYIAKDLAECASYIKNIHTTDTSALPWNSVAIKRFENKLGNKNLFAQISEYLPKPFADIDNKFSVSKFEKIVSSKVGKEYLGIENTEGLFTIKSPQKEKELETKITKIVNDINSGIIKSKTVQNSKNIADYLNNTNQKPSNEKTDRQTINDTAQKNTINTANLNTQEKKQDNVNIQNKELSLKSLNPNAQQSFIKSPRYIQKSTKSIFLGILIDKLNFKKDRALGIRNLCYEIQQMSRFGEDKKYTISFGFLVRSLLEQSAIYFLDNKGIWSVLLNQNNNKDLPLERVIKEIDKRKVTLFDATTLRCWNTFNETTASKDFFDLIVHHPYLISGNPSIVNNIGEAGLFAVIQFFINSSDT